MNKYKCSIDFLKFHLLEYDLLIIKRISGITRRKKKQKKGTKSSVNFL